MDYAEIRKECNRDCVQSLEVWKLDGKILVGLKDETGNVLESKDITFVVIRTSELLNKKIEELDLGPRAYHCLQFAKIGTIGDIIKRSRNDLYKIRNMGWKSIDEVEESLEKVGFGLKKE